MTSAHSYRAWSLGLALLASAALTQAAPPTDERALAESVARAEIARAAAILAEPDAPGRLAAARLVIGAAGTFHDVPVDVEALIGSLTVDGDPAIVRLASEFLSRRSSWPATEGVVTGAPAPDDLVRFHDGRKELEGLTRLLSNSSADSRLLAWRRLTQVLGECPQLMPEAADLIFRLSSDGDPEIAAQATVLWDRLQGRHISVSTAAASTATEGHPAGRGVPDPFEGLDDPNPRRRYSALHYLLEVGIGQWPNVDQRILNAFAMAAADPDPALGALAASAISGGLAGDPLALAEVFVSPMPAPMLELGVQPPSPAPAEGAPVYPGIIDEAGTFIATAVPGQAELPAQPPSPAAALAPAPPEGFYDRAGAFVSTARRPDEPSPAQRQP